MKISVRLFAIIAGPLIPLLGITPVSASAYYCGGECNGKNPSYVIPSNGIQCTNSKKVVATGHPRYKLNTGVSDYQYDTGLTIKTYYSSVCQTMWVTIAASSTHGAASSTNGYVTRTLAENVIYHVDTPKTGDTLTSVMVNDHSPSSGKAASFSYAETYAAPKGQSTTYTYDSSY